ncbi:DUF1427 family protein [Gloeocapsa sp. BRSZ]
MKNLFISLVAGWLIGILFSWLQLPLPVPPIAGLAGLAGMSLGGWSLKQLIQLWTRYF